ncbi:hypothetical protein SCLCIDRAFT_511627 [Scleroderma citrinum Foug A]|uniref:CBF1-interacting co-repressor CIR N-terminal domain-containing protein n=1 Tax=Scleroderma citrinum Foug A TaxID=1036808 RepID=A0A0C3EPW7_9AGAM|nr:hypothetical protein SCLCIDRAFT_511627 [Scleroderma citrinum Foug A]
MGGGDLNMKKSWHPLLLKNQERVWLEEKKALEEKKKLDQLRKEKEEERQLQELQRLQEEQTGKKRTEKLEWMYTTPATGSSANPNDLEDYLLGKKRVDKILIGDEHVKLGASHKSFIAVQNANTPRDVANKVREDPLLAMKQQEQAAYQALMSNPLRLRELQERTGIKPKKDKKEKKKEKKEKKERRERERDRESRSRGLTRPYTIAMAVTVAGARLVLTGLLIELPEMTGDIATNTAQEEVAAVLLTHTILVIMTEAATATLTTGHTDDHRRRYAHDVHKRRRSSSPADDNGSKRMRTTPPPPPPLRPSESVPSRKPTGGDEKRAARLAAMQSNAVSVETDRQKRLLDLLEKEKAELETENHAREKSKGMGGFLSQEQKRVFGGAGGLEDRIRRGRHGLVAEGD